jgi:solute carrier family 45, member 1/2/4
MNWSEYFPWLYTENCDTACVNLRVAFLLSIIMLTITVTLTVVLSKESPFHREEDTEKPQVFKKLWKVIRNLTPQLKRLYVCTGSSWFGWFAVIIYATTWVGQCVNNGDPHADEDSPEFKRYEEGVRYGSFGYAMFAIVSGAVSPLIGKCANKFGPKIVWTSGQIVFSVLLVWDFASSSIR